MQTFYLTLFLLLSLLSLGSAGNSDCDPQDPNCPWFEETLPDTMVTVCTGNQVNNDARIKTMARMMDWCYCGNTLNPNGLEYAGFSVYEDGVDLQQRNPSRTWACSKNKQETCEDFEDWYNALGNVTKECGKGFTGYFYDAMREMAWGFETYQDKTFCDSVWKQ